MRLRGAITSAAVAPILLSKYFFHASTKYGIIKNIFEYYIVKVA